MNSSPLPLEKFNYIKHQDDVYNNANEFCGIKVIDFDPENNANEKKEVAFRFRSDWEEDKLIPNLKAFLESDHAAEAKAIVIGHWGGDDSQGSPDSVLELLQKEKDKLPSLQAIYMGDIVMEENEMSWIQQSDLTPLLKSFPKLEFLRSRGGDGLEFSEMDHKHIRGLAIESGGLSSEVVRSVCNASFPNLEYLELWLGTEEYGGSSRIEDLQPILQGDLFPKLRHLGLRNCDYVDDIAAVIVNSPVINQIEYLDLSLGVLSDEGGKALQKLSTAGPLKSVSLHYNYMSDEVIEKLKILSFQLDCSKSDDQDEDEEWRFVAVGE